MSKKLNDFFFGDIHFFHCREVELRFMTPFLPVSYTHTVSVESRLKRCHRQSVALFYSFGQQCWALSVLDEAVFPQFNQHNEDSFIRSLQKCWASAAKINEINKINEKWLDLFYYATSEKNSNVIFCKCLLSIVLIRFLSRLILVWFVNGSSSLPCSAGDELHEQTGRKWVCGLQQRHVSKTLQK